MRLWPCVTNDLKTWIKLSLSNPPRISNEHKATDPTEVIGFSDASNEGFGALIFLPENDTMHLLAGHWDSKQILAHINQKEAWALEMLVDKLLTLQQDGRTYGPTKIYIDNTTVCSILEKERSRAFWANRWTLTMHRKLNQLDVSITWLPSIANLADKPSRQQWDGNNPRGTIQWHKMSTETEPHSVE
jgi:hypothetical protein